MRFHGRITDWKDEKGFGFITPDDGGRQVFVHISTVSDRPQRPVVGERVTFDLKIDPQGRPQAVGVIMVRNQSPPAATRGSIIGSFTLIVSIFTALACAVLAGRLSKVVPGVYLVASIVTFILYARDKSAAKNSRWRTSESRLLFLGLIGGWPGALLAQATLRHKSKKRSFQASFWFTVILNCAALAWLIFSSGSRGR